MTPQDRMFIAIGKMVVFWTGVEKDMIKLVQSSEVQDFPRQFSDLVGLWRRSLGDQVGVPQTEIETAVEEALELNRLRNLIAHNVDHVGLPNGSETTYFTLSFVEQQAAA